jgi:hypothetical protein
VRINSSRICSILKFASFFLIFVQFFPDFWVFMGFAPKKFNFCQGVRQQGYYSDILGQRSGNLERRSKQEQFSAPSGTSDKLEPYP